MWLSSSNKEIFLHNFRSEPPGIGPNHVEDWSRYSRGCLRRGVTGKDLQTYHEGSDSEKERKDVKGETTG